MDHNQSTNIELDPTNACPDFGLHDFITESNFDQFLELMIGDERSAPEPMMPDFGGGYVEIGQELMIGDDEVDRLLSAEIESQFNVPGLAMEDDPQLMSAADLFAFGHVDDVVGHGVNDQMNSFISGSLLCIDDVSKVGDDGGLMVRVDRDLEDDDDDDEDCNGGSVSSGTTTSATSKKLGKTDRSRTLISERRRRGRMKDNLYALRALVPNITKMDKASIVGDAVLYVQNLQVKAKLLKAEIAELEASVARQGLNGKASHKKSNAPSNNNNIFAPVAARYITQMGVFQVGEREFYVKVISNKGEKIGASLYKAIETFNGGFNVQSTNLSTVMDTYVLTFTLNGREGGEEMNLNLVNLKMWLSTALTSQGFILKLSP